MTKRTAKAYYLTNDGMEELRLSPPFARLPDDVQQGLEEYLHDVFGGMNRVERKLVRVRLEKLDRILGLEADSELLSAIESVLAVENAESPSPDA